MDVLRDRESFHQLEMLVNHSDAATAGIGRTRQRNRFAVHGEGSGIRHVEARRDVHER